MFRSRYRYLFILLLSVYSYINIKFTEGDQLFTEKWPEGIFVVIILSLVTLIWEGNRLIFSVIITRFKIRNTYMLLIYGFILSVAWVYLISFSSVYIQSLFGYAFTWIGLKLAIGFTFRVNLFLNCLNAIGHYHNKLREVEVAAEKHKKDLLNAQYESLRKQINPHFLFNSLNVLDSLIRKSDIPRATHFLEQLSKVYRYLTSMEQRDLVKLNKELDFIDSYRYMLETRFKNAFKIVIDINEADKQLYVVPSALQMLVENAVKHNEISQSRPMELKIRSENQVISVSNTIQQKKTAQITSKQGLINIHKRYEFLGINKFQILDDGTTFEVRIPLISL